MGASFKVNLGIKDLQRTLANIEKYDAATQEKLRTAVRTTTSNVMLGAKRRVKVRSGYTIGKISETYDAAKNTGIVKAKSPHAHLLEFGARAVREVPSRKKALKIGDEYAASANIPARKEHPFMRPAFEQEKPNLIKAVKDAVKP